MRISIIILLGFLSFSVFPQNFEFKWSISENNNEGFEVTVNRSLNSQTILIKTKKIADSTLNHISDMDCDTLFNFCGNYNYRYVSNTQLKAIIHYHDTTLNDEKNRIIINGQAIRPELMPAFGYLLDSTSGRFYRTESFSERICSGGNVFSGYFKQNREIKTYSIFSEFTEKGDRELNTIVYYLIEKYNTKFNLQKLDSILKNTKPVESDW
jgi:hypothetical protein